MTTKTITFTIKLIETKDDVKAHKLASLTHELVSPGTMTVSQCGVEGFGKEIEDSCQTMVFQEYKDFEGAPKPDEMVKRYVDNVLGMMTTKS